MQSSPSYGTLSAVRVLVYKTQAKITQAGGANVTSDMHRPTELEQYKPCCSICYLQAAAEQINSLSTAWCQLHNSNDSILASRWPLIHATCWDS